MNNKLNGNKIKHLKTISIILFVLSFITLILYNISPTPYEYMDYTSFIEEINNGQVEQVFLKDNHELILTLKDGSKFKTINPGTDGFRELLLNSNVYLLEKSMFNYVQLISSLILTISIIMIIFLYVKNNENNTSYINGLDDVSKKNSVKFSDVEGNDEAKESLKDIIDFLKNPVKYNKYGARMPKGIIFYGPPGTGKTLLARAVAGEAGVSFYALSGSDFMQMYVGVGAGRIRDLFKKARTHDKCVIFIDEIDAIGKKRLMSANSSDERDQTLNALLTEMIETE